MEAPKKIYVSPLLTEDGEKVRRRCTLVRQRNNQVEYIRKDAFIEKACKWLKEQEEMVGVSFKNDFIERFRNYMKGE